MPRKKNSIKKNSKKIMKKELTFNINPDVNPNGLVNPVMDHMSNSDKLAKMLNNITSNSFNDGIDTTIHNTASLLNNQLSEAVGGDPEFFNENNIKKILNYLIEPTFKNLNTMANNTNYNYNQFAGVLNENQMNKNNNIEQGGGFSFYPFNRMRNNAHMINSVPRRRIIPRVGYNFPVRRSIFSSLYPRTMYVPSMAIVTHDQVVDETDKRERAKLDAYCSYNHSFSSSDSEIKIRDHPRYGSNADVKIIESVGDNFYIVEDNESRKEVVYALNLFKSGRHAPIFDVAWKQLLDRISFRFKQNSKNSADKLYWRNLRCNNNIEGDSQKNMFSPGSYSTSNEPITYFQPGDIIHGYYKSNDRYVSVMRIEKKV